MNEHLSELLESLRFHKVEFLVIGAHALGVHGRVRMTEDIDLWAGRTRENSEHLGKALEAWGADIGPEGVEAFAEKDRQMIRLGVPPNMADIWNFAGTVPFDQAFARRVEASIGGRMLPIISRDDLIDAKRSAGRAQDLADLESLGADL